MTLDLQIRRQVPSVSAALKSLTAMERELSAAKTYDDIRRIIKEASAIKVLLGHVNEVKAQAENTILVACVRIGEEIKKVPKAGGPGRSKRTPRTGKSLSGREATGVPKNKRSQVGKLADAGAKKVKETAEALREQGKDATPRAVATALTQGGKKERRAERERTLGAKQLALPDKKFGVIVSDDEWDTKPYSRETGMDRNAANHYPTAIDAQTAAQMHERTKDRFLCAADDCVNFMWSTVQHLDVAIDLIRLRGFKYVSHYVWGKNKIGLGFWNRNKHELLLIGVKGKIPCPAPGEQWDSLIMAPVGEHSAKPECFLEMIEQYFPNLPKIELNRRGPARPGWDAWGNETVIQEAAE